MLFSVAGLSGGVVRPLPFFCLCVSSLSAPLTSFCLRRRHAAQQQILQTATHSAAQRSAAQHSTARHGTARARSGEQSASTDAIASVRRL